MSNEKYLSRKNIDVDVYDWDYPLPYGMKKEYSSECTETKQPKAYPRKFNARQVQWVKDMLEQGATQRGVARQFKQEFGRTISQSTVFKMSNGIYKH